MKRQMLWSIALAALITLGFCVFGDVTRALTKGCFVCSDGQCYEQMALSGKQAEKYCVDRSGTLASYNANGACWKGGCADVKAQLQTRRKRGVQ